MNKHYINEVGTDVIVDCGCDISTATVKEIRVKKPDGKIVKWDDCEVFDNNYLVYTLKEGDLDLDGSYALQVYIEIDNWKGLGEVALFKVYNLWE